VNRKDVLKEFINEINYNGLMTSFIKNFFDYKYLNDYNYIFRMIDNEMELIIDIYDNVSENRFNRYVFNFESEEYDVMDTIYEDVFVKYINVIKVRDSDDKILKLAYLFRLDNKTMIKYAYTFLEPIFVDILVKIINKPI